LRFSTLPRDLLTEVPLCSF